MARFASINLSCISSCLKQFCYSNSQYTIIIGYHISLFVPEHFWRKRAYYACLWSAIAQISNGDINFLLFHININKMEHQVTENKEIYFSKKCPDVSSDLKYTATALRAYLYVLLFMTFLVFLPLSHNVSCVRCGTWLYRFLNLPSSFLFLLTRVSSHKKYHILCYPLRTNSGWLPIRCAYFILYNYWLMFR